MQRGCDKVHLYLLLPLGIGADIAAILRGDSRYQISMMYAIGCAGEPRHIRLCRISQVQAPQLYSATPPSYSCSFIQEWNQP